MYSTGFINANTLSMEQNGSHFVEDIFKFFFLFYESCRISIQVPLKFVPNCTSNNNPALIQVMDWHRTGEKLLSEPI